MTSTETKPVVIKHTLNALTTCDRYPSAKAYAVTYKESMELYWCKHCSDIHSEKLFIEGWNIDDQTSILTGEIEAYNKKDEIT